MDARFKELADKAQEIAEWSTPQGLEWFEAFKEEYAKLIIKECLTEVSKNLKQRLGVEK